MFDRADLIPIEYQIKVEDTDLIPIPDEDAKNDNPVLENPEYHEKLLNYLKARLDSDVTSRLRRVRRYARIDQHISTWQKLSPEDSIREANAENSGRAQAVPLNVPLTKSNLEDSTAFFSDIFAPFGDNFYGNPSKPDISPAVQLIAKKMNEDSKHNAYFAEVTQAMSSLFKYNATGFHVDWSEVNELDRSAGNRTEAVDLYNLFYDTSVQDIHKLHSEGEWAAIASVKTRLWLLRLASEGDVVNLDKVLLDSSGKDKPSSHDAKYYRYPPAETHIEADGSDTKTSHGEHSSEDPNFDWASLGLDSGTSVVKIPGYEVIKMYCWISKKQFEIQATDDESTSDLALYRFTIVDGSHIVKMERISPQTTEIPIYLARMSRDELREAARSAAEHIKPFQSFVSFLLNTHVAGVRSNIWGFKVYDPKMIDISNIKSGDVAGMIPTKQQNRDVRTAFQQIRGEVDTRGNLADAGVMMDLMKQFYPNQALPAQVAQMQRAVTNQVSTVVQGSTRKMFMFCRLIDADLMRNVRKAQFNNLINFDSEKNQMGNLKTDEVANLLNSGLGQLNREMAAEHIKDLIFTLTQNPEAIQGMDMRGLYTAYSAMLSLGFNLGDFVPPPQQQQAAGAEMPAGAESGVPVEGGIPS